MSKVTAAAVAKKTHLAEVVRHGTAIVLPEGMKIPDAVKSLQDLEKRQEEVVNLIEDIPVFPWDGAHALSLAIEQLYGFSFAKPTFGFFGNEIPPAQIAIEVGPGVITQVPWGRLGLPSWETDNRNHGFLQTAFSWKEGRLIFRLQAIVKRKYEEEFKKLALLTRKIASERSIYKGKAFKIRFKDERDNPLEMPEPSFIDLSRVKEDELIYAKEVNDAIVVNLFTPIEHMDECRKLGIPTKRGILLAGPYGTGKTMAAYVAAKKATDRAITFIYCVAANEFPEVVRFAMQYAPAVIFCEDIDRVTDGERDLKMDEILNIIDGIESKKAELIFVLTSNEVEKISKAMLRPGRLDAVIHVTPPDADAAKRLVEMYARGLLDASADLTEVGRLLDGKIPAVIREVTERSKLAQISVHRGGEFKIGAAALVTAAKTMEMQLELLNATPGEERDVLADLGRAIAGNVKAALKDDMNKVHDIHVAMDLN